MLIALLHQSQECFQDQQNHLFHTVLTNMQGHIPAIHGRYQATIVHFKVIAMKLKAIFQICKDMLMMLAIMLNAKLET